MYTDQAINTPPPRRKEGRHTQPLHSLYCKAEDPRHTSACAQLWAGSTQGAHQTSSCRNACRESQLLSGTTLEVYYELRSHVPLLLLCNGAGSQVPGVYSALSNLRGAFLSPSSPKQAAK